MKRIITLLLLMCISSVYAGDGHYLKESCIEAEKLWSDKAGDKEKGIYCTALLNGIVSVMTITANSSNKEAANQMGMCNKEKPGYFITTEKSIATVLKYLYSNPDKLELQDFVITMSAMKTYFPCAK